ncbi:MAG: hypothetical protein L6V81_07285 [Clostridium sp.]|nr:MAG: hypothetical protein L6V81_07285 [Clostridium sp.]
MTLLWSNATYEDFNDPINFFKKANIFLNNDLFNYFDNGEIIGYSETLGGEISVQNIRESIMNETPNSIQIVLTNDGEKLLFSKN